MAIEGRWQSELRPEFSKPYYAGLYKKVIEEYSSYTIYPPKDEIFRAFAMTPFEDTRVLILGQDPYHEPGQANGLCFSVRNGVRIPPSLVNIFKEMHDDLGVPIPKSGELEGWARQGVLLLNTVLTVRAHIANSHKGIGWEQFTDAAIRALSKKDGPMVFILWGGAARKKKDMITDPRHLVIESAHPSPLSAYNGFFGSRPFSRCNDYLTSHGLPGIRWEETI